MGRSPQDVEDQISYPLTVSLLGIPGVKTIRSFSMFGFSTIYVIFNEDVDFDRLFIYAFGFTAWKEAGLPIEQGDRDNGLITGDDEEVSHE